MIYIRNFSIIAHVDHGKSTISDRFIQLCQGLSEREMRDQVLDTLEIERARGITIKAQSVSLRYQSKDGHTYILNLIDTPGHVDFSYEVTRSLSACEGALLVVDSSSQVQAQTVSTCHAADKAGLTIIPVANKIDLPSSDIVETALQIEDIIGLDAKNILSCSGKANIGIAEILEEIIRLVPAPTGDPNASVQALIIDAWFDNYSGVICLVRVREGTLKIGDFIQLAHGGKKFQVESLGIFTPKRLAQETLSAGEVGFVIANIKNLAEISVGDTIISAGSNVNLSSLPAIIKASPQIYACIFPIDGDDFEKFRTCLSKLALNDQALTYQPEVSHSLGHGFRCGFLGTLHIEVVKDRLDSEYGLDLIVAPPSVAYQITDTKGNTFICSSPKDVPEKQSLASIAEPRVKVDILIPKENVGDIITLCQKRRGHQISFGFGGRQANLVYDLPMSEVIADFAEQLKSLTHGYGSFSYTMTHFEPEKMVLMSILLNGSDIDSLTQIIHVSESASKGRKIVDKLATIIPRGQFEVRIQAAIGAKIIASASIKPYRKDVTAKCYGGDVSRKRKLLEKQKKGKKKMKQIGNIDIPQSAFISLLK